MQMILPALLFFAATPVTYTRDVAPVFLEHCVKCHRPGEVAPMSLLDYKSARPWAKAIGEAVSSRRMPPWFADPHFGAFSNDARLSDTDIATIRAWVAGGALEGDPKQLPQAPKFTEGWELGPPDRIIDIGQTYTLKPGRDSYEHFVVETNSKEGMWLRAADLHPGNRKVVHHAHVNLVASPQQAGATTIQSMTSLSDYLVKDGNLTRISESAPILDDACRADAPDLPYIRGAQEGALASYLPGRSPDVFGDGRAKWVPPGAKLEFVIHYAPMTGSDATATDRTSVALYFAPGPPEQVLRRMDLRNFFFRIPPGEPAHAVKRCYAFERDQTLLSITPHMHYRGKDARYDLIRPDGTRETLLNVPNYNFNWQLVYRMRDPIAVQKGSRLEVTVHFDNSPNNPANPDATRAIRWGDKTEEEMMTSWIEYVEPKPTQK
ncbi:MAG: hypothetical protein JWN34_4102 [Bryobacterales bacterium]|nr:hypothetical protein [Bryobacterales bacterium]